MDFVVDGFAMEADSGDFGAAVKAVRGATDRPLILIGEAATLEPGLQACSGETVLIHAATDSNWEAMADLAAKYKAALGVRNILCLSGDSMKMAPDPKGRMDVIDIDSIQMLWILRKMRDEGKYLDGRNIKFPPKYFPGAAASPFASKPKFQALREHKKVNAGAQFFQTNLVYDADGLEIWLNEIARRGILDKVYILIGITPIKNCKIARYMNDTVPGVFIPDKLIKRMEDAETRATPKRKACRSPWN